MGYFKKLKFMKIKKTIYIYTPENTIGQDPLLLSSMKSLYFSLIILYLSVIWLPLSNVPVLLLLFVLAFKERRAREDRASFPR